MCTLVWPSWLPLKYILSKQTIVYTYINTCSFPFAIQLFLDVHLRKHQGDYSYRGRTLGGSTWIKASRTLDRVSSKKKYLEVRYLRLTQFEVCGLPHYFTTTKHRIDESEKEWLTRILTCHQFESPVTDHWATNDQIEGSEEIRLTLTQHP